MSQKEVREKFQQVSGAGVRWGVRWEGVGVGVGEREWGSEGGNRVSLDFCLGQTGWPWVAFYPSQTQFPHLY